MHILRPQTSFLGSAAIACLLGGFATQVHAQATHAQHAHAADPAGHAAATVDFPVSCTPQAQAKFNEAATLLHHMTYPQARQAFEQVVTLDPACAMAHWGIAMTLFQPLWPTRPKPHELQRGWDATQQAKALAPPTQRERMFVEAAEAFFSNPTSNDYWLRIRRWEAASQKMHEALPDEPEATVFYALSHLATSPAGKLSREHADRAAALLIGVYEDNPEHPGAMHYLVHANDAPGRERESLDITRKYDAAAPDNPHALHMPTHIYTRLGDWDAVIRGNLRAANAALKYPAGDNGQFVWDEFPHAIEYLVYAYLQKGDDVAAAAQIARLRNTANIEPTFKTAFHHASTQARYALERRDWAAAASIVPRTPENIEWDRFAWPEAVAQFAHGLGAARTGKLDAAKAASTRLAALALKMETAQEDLFARSIRVLRLELDAWTMHARQRNDTAIELMQQAVELEASAPKHAVTPAPILPASEQLGDLLMELGNPNDASAAYARSKLLYPNRFNTLLGAARAAVARKNPQAAQASYRALLDMAASGSRQSPLQEARAYRGEH